MSSSKPPLLAWRCVRAYAARKKPGTSFYTDNVANRTHMETTLTDRFALVQDVYQLDDWQTAAALLTEVLGLPAVAARQQTRKSHGYLAVNLTGELAQRLRRRLCRAGALRRGRTAE